MKNEQMVGARVPAGLVRDLEVIEKTEHCDRSATVRRLLARAVRDWKLDHYAQAYAKQQITLARAAQAAGVTLWEMMSFAHANKIPAQYDGDDLKKDLARLKSRPSRPR